PMPAHRRGNRSAQGGEQSWGHVDVGYQAGGTGGRGGQAAGREIGTKAEDRRQPVPRAAGRRRGVGADEEDVPARVSGQRGEQRREAVQVEGGRQVQDEERRV